jgi:outer membrane protein
MKNIFTILVVAALSTTLSAQIQKGSVLLNGVVGFNNISIDGSSYTTIYIAPSAGFFLSNRFVLGGTFSFSALFRDEENTTNIGLEPFARYYFNGSGAARFFGQARGGFSVDGSFNGDPYLNFGVGLGVDFFLNDFVAIEASLGYDKSYIDLESAGGGINNIGINVGVAAFLNKKQD